MLIYDIISYDAYMINGCLVLNPSGMDEGFCRKNGLFVWVFSWEDLVIRISSIYLKNIGFISTSRHDHKLVTV